MNWPTAVVIIVSLSLVAKVMMAKYRAQAGIIADKQGNEKYIERSTNNADAQREITELRERIKVLERIATDANTSESRKIEAISQEIESLRDK